MASFAAITGGAIAIAGSSSPETGPERMQGEVATVDARIGKAFGLFRSDELQVKHAFSKIDQNPFGQNTGLSRAVPVSRGGAVYVIPGNDAICLGDNVNYGHTCVSVDTAIAGGLYLITLGDPKEPYTSVSGLAPDGVARVSIELSSGQSVRVPVSNNVFDFKFAGVEPAVTGISWTNAAGQRVAQQFPDGGIRRPSTRAVDPTGR